MDGITILFGLGILLFLVLYTAFNLDKNHFFLKTLLIIMAFFTFLLIPKIIIDNNDYCETVVTGANTTITDYTAYTYERVCFENDNNTASTLFNGVRWFIVIFVIYVFVYMNWELLGERIIKKYNRIFGRGKK